MNATISYAALKAFLPEREVFDWDEFFGDLQPILETSPALAKEAVDSALQVYARHRDEDEPVHYVMGKVLVLLAKTIAGDPELANRVLDLTRSFKDTNMRVRVLTHMAPHLPEARRPAIAAEAESLVSNPGIGENERALIAIRLSELKPFSESRELLMKAREFYSTIGDSASYCQAFVGLLESVAPENRKAAAFRAAQFEYTGETGHTGSALAAHLLRDAPRVPEMGPGSDADTAQAIRKARLFLSLAGLFEEEHDELEQMGMDALDSLTANQREDVMKAFTDVPPNPATPVVDPPPGNFAEAWSAASAITDVHHRLMALTRLVPYAEPERKPELMLDIIGASSSIGEEDYIADVLGTLSELVSLTPEAFNEVLKLARAMRDRQDAAGTIAYLVPHAPAGNRAALFREAVAAARSVEYEHNWKVRFLFMIALPNCPETELFDTLNWGLMTVLDDERVPDTGALREIVKRMKIHDREEIAPVLSAAFDLLSGKPREYPLVFLSHAHPLIEKCCGAEAIAETLAVTAEVVRYFP